MTDADETRLALLRTALEAAVPLYAMQLREKPWSEIQRIAAEAGQMIAEHGDDVLFRSKKKGASAAAFNALARGIAALSFVPGGVTLFGLHFENTQEE